MSKEKILVAGATGNTGQKIVDILKSSEHYKPIAMVRKEEQQKHFEDKGVSIVCGDLEKDVEHTLEGIDKVIFAAGSGGKKVIEVDQEGAKKLIDASENNGINKFIMLSSMGADDPSVSQELEDYLKAKQNADEHLQNSNINYTIVRPGALTNENGSGKIELKSKLNKFGEISRDNVAKTLVHVLDNDIKKNKTFEILEGETPIKAALKS